MLKPAPVFGRRLSLFLAVGALLPIVTSLYVTHTLTQSQRELLVDLQRHDKVGRQYDALGNRMRELAFTTFTALSSSTSPVVEMQGLRAADARAAAEIAAARRDVESHAEEEPERLGAMANLDRIDVSRAAIVAASDRALQALANDHVAGAGAEVPSVRDASREAFAAIAAVRGASRAQQRVHLKQANAQSERLKILERLLYGLFLVMTMAVAVRARRASRERMHEGVRQQRVAALQRRNEVLEEALAGIATFDRRTRLCTWGNSTFAEITGYSPQNLIGVPMTSMVADEDQHLFEPVEAELRQCGRAELDVRARKKDGTVAHVHVVLVLREDADTFCFVKDVTAEKEAEAALRQMDERFRLAMLATRDIFYDWDLTTNRAWVSDAAFTEFKFSRDGDGIEQWIQSIHPDDQKRVMSKMDARIAEGFDLVVDEYRVRRPDGSWADVFDRLYVVRDENRVAHRLVGAITDISDHRKMLHELERLSMQNRMILASAGDGIFGLDIEGLTTFANPSATALLGWTADELLGKPLHDIVHLGEHDVACTSSSNCTMLDALTRETTAGGKATYRKKDGSTVPVEFTSQPMSDQHGVVVGAVLTVRDITARVAVERMKDEFISIVSHELRTPLTSIRGALGLVAGGRAGTVPEKMSRMMEIAVSNTDRLVRLVNDILDIERMESGTITLARQMCAAEALIDDAIEPMKPLADQAGVRLERGLADGVLFADRDRLLQTLTNLIGNAIKFSPRGAAVRVSAWMEGRDVRFLVEDEGRGIPQDKVQSIFERFQQVDATDSREKGGSGLGLAICRSIVRQHGGEIWAESDGNSGSRLHFTLPRVQRAASTATAQTQGTVVV